MIHCQSRPAAHLVPSVWCFKIESVNGVGTGMSDVNMSGVIVTSVDPGSKPGSSGITEGTLIREVNGKPVRNVREFNRAIEQAKKQGRVTLRIYTEGFHYFVFLKL